MGEDPSLSSCTLQRLSLLVIESLLSVTVIGLLKCFYLYKWQGSGHLLILIQQRLYWTIWPEAFYQDLGILGGRVEV